tara:strand:+ start:644 stop:1621 length:978 start_codon:yes stop_codon:yes gene_type:complete
VFLAHTSIDQAEQLAAAVAGAARINDCWCTDFQPYFLRLIFRELLGVDIDFETVSSMDVDEAGFIFPDPLQRKELIELLVLTEVMVNPIPSELESSLENWAKKLQVEDRSLVLARDVANTARAQAQSNFYRLFWMGEEDRQQKNFEDLLRKHGPEAWTFTVEEDPKLASQWRALANLPEGTLGAAVWNHYQSHGFTTPGEIGGANAALAHHDWLHVIGGYDVDLIGEVENAAFGASSSSVPGSTLWFLGVMAMYEGGLFDSVVTGGHPHQISMAGNPERVVDAMNRGRQCKQDLLAIDYFSIADQSLLSLQKQWGLIPHGRSESA